MAEDAKTGGLPPDEGDTAPERGKSSFVDATPVGAGMVLAERYELRKVIGRGGMGLVLEAYDRVLGASVAIKIVRAEYAGERHWAERLAREVKLARQIQHPNVCRVFDFEQAAGRVFLVMELAGQGTLRAEIASGSVGARSVAERFADARAIVEGLAAIHDAGIIHRDLAPQNLLRMSDGRLVISDFGLAIDAFESATSLRGGTVAYMAPEVVRGAAVSFAADVWSLGVVLYEAVFGERPRWREPFGGGLLDPSPRRRLDRAESRILEICRACTAGDPTRRPSSARAVADWLVVTGAPGQRLGHGSRKVRLAAFAGATLIATGLLIRGRGVSLKARPLGVVAGEILQEELPLIVPKGDPVDWTKKARILAEVPDRIHCLRALPDRRTIRFVWGEVGQPKRAEDLDIVTGARVPSPLAPEAYAVGCPDLSPDGRRLVYQGRVSDGSPFAFVSSTVDGAHAEAMVQTDDPTISSDPQWLPDSNAFTYEIDAQHVGAFVISERRTIQLRQPTSEAIATSFKYRAEAGPIVAGLYSHPGSVIAYLAWPSLRPLAGFRTVDYALDVGVEGESTFYYVTARTDHPTTLVVVDLKRRTALRLGEIAGDGTIVRYPTLLPLGVVLVNVRVAGNVAVRGNSGQLEQITSDGAIWAARPCGKDIVAVHGHASHIAIVRMDRRGRILERFAIAEQGLTPACSPDGSIWYQSDWNNQGLKACDHAGCRQITKQTVLRISVSPDGRRLLVTTMDEKGPQVQWMPAEGGELHLVARTGTICTPGWSGTQTAWVSREARGKSWWEEVNVDSGRATGTRLPGAHNCSDGGEDPLSPVDRDVRLIVKQPSEVRFLPREQFASSSW